MAPQSSSARQPNEESWIVLHSAGRGGEFDGKDALEAFHSEADWPDEAFSSKQSPVSQGPAPAVASAASSRPTSISLPVRQEARGPRVLVTILLAAIAIAEAPFVAMWVLQDRPEIAPVVTSSVGTVLIESQPSGAEIMVNGTMAGHTPARLTLPRGTVELRLRHEDSVRVLPFVVTPGDTMRLHVEFAAPESVQSSAGDLALR